MAEKQTISRRHLFAGFGMAMTAGLAMKFAPTDASSKPVSSEPGEGEMTKYRLTEHIKKYYRTTTF